MQWEGEMSAEVPTWKYWFSFERINSFEKIKNKKDR